MARFEFKGWTFSEWLVGNASTIKELFKVGVPFGIAFLNTQAPMYLALWTVLGKLVLDTVDYYIAK